MASNLKRRREPVSYKEPSSDEDFSEDDDSSVARPRKRSRPTRRSTRRRVSDSDPAASDPESDAPATSPPADSPVSVRLRGRQRITYQEPSTGDEPESGGSSEDAFTPRTPRRANASRSSRPDKQRKHRKTRRKRQRELGAPYKPKKEQRDASPPWLEISDMRIPDWASLPHHVLLQLFVYAAHPLHDDNFTPTPSISWLARTARICQAFARPALTALYRNPPIFALKQNRSLLVHHLITPPPDSFLDYTVMVKRLEIDATRMSKLTDPQHSVSDLAALILSLKTLNAIDIFDPWDKPPYRERSRPRRWTYPDELFDALSQSELHLRSWRWNSNFLAKDLLWMKGVHESPAFQSLRDVTLTKFHGNTANSDDEQPTTEELLGSALAVLPNLRSLTFETCTALNGRLLPLLPKNLVSLTITNCRELTSDALQAFLTTHGNHLDELVINHNQALDLAFLVSLKQSAPRLEILRVDMHYYSTLALSSDNEPWYDELLMEDEIPTWPSTLRIIDMEFLRKWKPKAAIGFFTSLIDSAEELPLLQELKVTAIVDMEWRLRAEFRKKWTHRFHKVFERKWIAPDPSLRSFKAFRLSKEAKAGNDKSAVVGTSRAVNTDLTVQDESETEQREPKQPEPESSDSGDTTSRKPQKPSEKWGTRRLRSRNRSSKYDEGTSEDESSSDQEDSDLREDQFIQGGCHKIVFRVDNIRPQEQMYAEEDFLDSEVSGDEDWVGDDVAEEGYAW